MFEPLTAVSEGVEWSRSATVCQHRRNNFIFGTGVYEVANLGYAVGHMEETAGPEAVNTGRPQ